LSSRADYLLLADNGTSAFDRITGRYSFVRELFLSVELLLNQGH
jgi:hypothetical protein